MIDPNDGNRNAKFTSDVEPGDIIRVMKTGGSVDIRVTGITSDTELLSDYLDDVDTATAYNYKILKCAAGRIDGANHDAIDNTGGAAHVPDESALPYLPTPSIPSTRLGRTSTARLTPGAAASACRASCSRSSLAITTSSPITPTTTSASRFTP